MDTPTFRIRVPLMMWAVVAVATGLIAGGAVLVAFAFGVEWPGLVAVAVAVWLACPAGFYGGSTWGKNAVRPTYHAGMIAGRIQQLNATHQDPAFIAVRHAAHIGAARAGVIPADDVEPCGGPSCVFCRERDSQPVMDTPDAPTGPTRPFPGAVEVTLTPHGPVQRTYDEAGRVTDSKMYRPGPWADRPGLHDGYGRPVPPAADDTPTSSGGCDDGGNHASGHCE